MSYQTAPQQRHTFGIFRQIVRSGRVRLATLGLVLLSPAAADGQDVAARSGFVNYLRGVTRYSPIETAGSHGSLGGSLGLGLSSVAVDPGNYYVQSRVFATSSSAESRTSVSRVFFNKGTAVPVDFGFSVGRTDNDNVTFFGGHVQWTYFEQFRLPALALRGTYSTLSGMRATEASSLGADALVSQSLMSYFTFYMGVGAQLNMFSFDEHSAPTFSRYGVVATSKIGTYSDNFLDYHHRYGVKLLLYPSIISVSSEVVLDTGGNKVFYLKTSLEG